MERDQTCGSNENIIRVIKNRVNGKVGEQDKLFYNVKTGRLTPMDDK
jgi:hypothetical protein